MTIYFVQFYPCSSLDFAKKRFPDWKQRSIKSDLESSTLRISDFDLYQPRSKSLSISPSLYSFCFLASERRFDARTKNSFLIFTYLCPEMKSLFSSRDKVFFLCLLLCPQGFQPSASPKSAVFLIWIYVLLAVAFYYKTGTQNLFFGRCAFYNNISVAFFFAAMIACSAPMKKNSIVLKITTFSNRLLLLPLQTSRT